MELSDLANEMRRASEFWFPEVHARTSSDIRLHYTLGLAGESGEVANVVKKANRSGGRPNVDDLAAELADTFTYLMLLANHEGIDLIAAYWAKREVCIERWGDPDEAQP